MIILIDTSKIKEVSVGIRFAAGRSIWKREAVITTQAQRILPMIVQFLKEHKKNLIDISAIEIVSGPGSYTGLRVGFSVANTLGHMLGVSINTLPAGQIALPKYE